MYVVADDEDDSYAKDSFESMGYNQFIQSLHCQFFHSDSSLYANPYFPVFTRKIIALLTKTTRLMVTHFSCRNYKHDDDDDDDDENEN